MFKIYLPIGFISDDFKKAKAYCEHFHCKMHKQQKGSAENCIETDAPINFFWLGVNLHLKSESTLTITPAEKYLK